MLDTGGNGCQVSSECGPGACSVAKPCGWNFWMSAELGRHVYVAPTRRGGARLAPNGALADDRTVDAARPETTRSANGDGAGAGLALEGAELIRRWRERSSLTRIRRMVAARKQRTCDLSR